MNGQAESLVVAPLTGWGVARIERQIGASLIGAIATIVERAEGGTDLAPILPSTAITRRARRQAAHGRRAWELAPYIGFSSLFGSSAAITNTEEDSTHYFQRPDQPHVHVDDDAHHLLGWQGGVIFDRRAGEWRPTIQLDAGAPATTSTTSAASRAPTTSAWPRASIAS